MNHPAKYFDLTSSKSKNITINRAAETELQLGHDGIPSATKQNLDQGRDRDTISGAAVDETKRCPGERAPISNPIGEDLIED